MIPKAKTIAVVEYQLQGAKAWAERNEVPLDWDPDNLELRAILTQPSTGEGFYLRGRFEGYPAHPPEWTFCSSDWDESGKKRFFPAPNGTPFSGSVMHSNGLICAHFNRLAFDEHGGPHGDWGGPAQWITPKNDTIYADTIGDMLKAIQRDLNYSQGRMSP
jgi:hypothetical protein